MVLIVPTIRCLLATPGAWDNHTVRIGIVHHYGWAVVIAASATFEVIDRRRIALIDDGLIAAPIHHAGGTHELHAVGPPLSDEELARLVATVRGSVRRRCEVELAAIEDDIGSDVEFVAVRQWPDPFPTDIATLRRPPYESRADSVMYCETLADEAERRGWPVVTFDAKVVERHARDLLGARADEVLIGPRTQLGAPWTKDHRMALAATIVGA